MSQKDKIQARRDKILDVLRQYGALSTAQTTKILNEKYSLRFNKKTIERDFHDLLRDGKIAQNPSIGREQTYSFTQKTRPISEFFINNFWKDVFDIRRLNAKDSLEAFWLVRSLIKTWPEMYEQLEPDIEKTHRSLIEYQEKDQHGYYYLGAFTLCGVPDVENLIGKVAAFLHEQFERLQKEKPKT